MTLEQDWARFLDREDIIGRKLAFARAADAGDADAMVVDFADDAVATYDPALPMAGRAAIRDWYASALGAVVSSSHMLTNLEVELVADDAAVLRCYLYSWQRFDPSSGREDRHRWARYRDEWRRLDGAWRLTSLRLLAAGETPPAVTERDGEYRSEGF